MCIGREGWRRARDAPHPPLSPSQHHTETGFGAARTEAPDLWEVPMRRALTFITVLAAFVLLVQSAVAVPAARATEYRVGFGLSKSSVFINQVATFYGSVRTAAGAPGSGVVTIQKWRASDGAWVNWRTDGLSSSGKYYLRVRMTTKQTARFRVRMPDGSATAYSSVRELRVKGLNSVEAAVVKLVNQERAKRGLRPLVVRWRLTRPARIHSADMVRRNRLTHYSSNGDSVARRLRRYGYSSWGYRYWTVGEDIARAKQGTLYATPTVIVQRWMSSSAHRRVILGRTFRDVGMGVRTSSSGMRYFTLDVGRRIR